MYYLKNKVLLITGSSGIAAATIKLSLQQHAKVFFAGIDKVSCEQLKIEADESNLSELDYFVGDLRMPSIAEEIVNHCLSRFGKIDGLFNVAGISGRKFGDGPLTECTDVGWETTLQSNLDTQFRMCRTVIPAMMKSERDENGQRGTILNMSSILGIDPEPNHFSALAYATSKGAIVTMTKTMAAYYAIHGIRINALAPGLTATKMSSRASTDSDIITAMKKKQPLTNGVMDPIDVADAAVFLLGNQSRAITGQTLIVDAGWSIS